MRIVFDVSHIQRGRAGIGRYTDELLRALLEADTENEFLLFGWSLSLDSKRIRSYSGPRVHMRLARVPGAFRRHYWTRMPWPKVGSLVGRFDLFHSSEPFLPPLGNERGVISVYDLAYRRFPMMFEQYVLRLDPSIRRAVDRADAIVVPSEFTKMDLLEAEKIDRGKVHVVQPAVSLRSVGDAARDRATLARLGLDAPYILTVGTIEPRKNHISLIRAFEKVAEGEPDLHLIVVGKLGWHYSEAVAAMNSSAHSHRIHHVGYVSEEDLDAVYRGAKCVVYPSLFEGGGLPVLEAMSAGTPVVTSNTSAMKEMGEGAAILVSPNDPEEIAAGIEAVLRDSVLADNLAQMGIARAKNYAPSVPAQKILQLYKLLA